MPVPDTNGEEWDRLEAANGVDALLELIMHGEYNGQDAARRLKDSVDLRATAVGVFEVCSLPHSSHGPQIAVNPSEALR
jgi:intracellular protein transport protein USO1